MMALLLLFLLTNCLNLVPKITAKAAPKAAPKAALKAFRLAVPIIGGFPQDEMNMFEEAENPGLMLKGGGVNGGVGGRLLKTYHLLPGMNRQLSTSYHPGAHQLPSTGGGGGGGGGRGTHSQWNFGNDASSIAGGTNRQLARPTASGDSDCQQEGCTEGYTCIQRKILMFEGYNGLRLLLLERLYCIHHGVTN